MRFKSIAKKKPSKKMELVETVALYLNNRKPLLYFEAEFRFHPKRMWRFDFAIPTLKIAIEVHGQVYDYGPKCRSCGKRKFAGGRHTRGVGFHKDREKMNTAQLMGWVVLEFAKEPIVSGEFIETIEQAVKARS